MKESSQLILETNLQPFFFDSLQEFNKKLQNPLSSETIYYSSLVMDNFSKSSNFFEQVEDKAKEKILGIKLMESVLLSKTKQKMALKDIAETSLFVCGYFADSFKNKMTSVKYYEDLGKTAYLRLNSIAPAFYDIPFFYKKMSLHFGDVALLMNLVSKKCSDSSDPDMPWLILQERKVS